MNQLTGKSGDAVKMLSKEFNNIEDKLLTLQKNQVEFEKYLLEILKYVKK